MKPFCKRAWAEVKLETLAENINIIKSHLKGDTQIMAVIKADAYGHGEGEICKKLWEIGVKYFAVSNLDEAISVREHCPLGEILILGYTPPECTKSLEEYNIIQGVVSLEHAKLLSENANSKVRCHIKLDTGMGRIGLKHDLPQETADDIQKILEYPKLSIEGIYSHFAVADSDSEEDISYTDNQAKFMCDTYDELLKRGIKLQHLHFLNSAGACYHDNKRSTLARIGITMYGLYPNSALELPYKVEPVMDFKAVISCVKYIEKGDCVSYGRTYTADGEVKVATVTVGYADGYSRLLSSKGEVLVRGTRCKIIGRVCMDQLMIDVSHLKDVEAGEVVTLIGKDGNERITADDLANIYGTIGYEVVCGISKRVPRIYIW